MLRASLVCAAVTVCAVPIVEAQQPVRPDGWVVIPVDEYRALRLKAFPPDRPPDLPPVEATVTRVEYDLRVNGDSASGEARLTVDVLKEGWVAVEIPAGLLVRGARLDGRAVPLIPALSPYVLLSKVGRTVLSLDVVIPLRTLAASESLTLPPSSGAVSRLALVVPRAGIDVVVSGGLLAERAETPEGRWVAFARAGQPLTLTWKQRAEDARASQSLKWRGSVTQIVALGEDASPVTATVRIDVSQGLASTVDVAIADGLVVNQVSGPLVADWDFRPGTLKVNFLEPVGAQTSFSISGEARVPRDGSVSVPLIRLPAAERETGGIAVEVLGAGEISGREPRGLDAADPSDLGEMLRGRESPSMMAFRFRPQDGRAARSLAVTVARYTPQAVLIANVEEARYDALVTEEGKALVRARYAVRNNQRAFLAVTLPAGATLWSASVAGRPLRPGVSTSGLLLLGLEKGRAGEETPTFAVEMTYVERGAAWGDKGRTALVLPAIDLPISRTAVTLHYSPRFEVTPEPGAFRVETDAGPFSPALRGAPVGIASPAPPPPPPAAAEMDFLVSQFSKDSGGRTVAGPLPVGVPFPEFGPTVFLMSELTAESQAPTLQFTYKRESRW
jgi:hypothetical protein